MPNYVRWRDAGASYFFTVVTHRRRPILDNPKARRWLRQSFVHTRRRFPFELFAIVLLPDHLHCLWSLPDGDDDFPKRWAMIKQGFSRQYLAGGGAEGRVSDNRQKHRERGVWQARYWEHRVRDEDEWFAYRDYIHLNPVRHGLVDDPLAWPWSSVHRHLRLGWLSNDWTSWSPISADVAGEPS